MLMIRNQAQLDRYLAHIDRGAWIAVDTEFVREGAYLPRLALIQVAAGDAPPALIDPFDVTSLGGVFDLLADGSVRKVMHACSQDMEIFTARMGDAPRSVFDTQVAAAFLGHGFSVGLGRLLEAELGVVLDKSQTYTDWLRRPLNAAQLAYAAEDVRYLPALAARLEASLDARGRLGWVAPYMQALSDPSQYVVDPLKAYLGIKRLWLLDRRQLGVLREVAAWRERTAARDDRPRGAVATDDCVRDIAVRCPRRAQELARWRGIGRAYQHEAPEQIVDAVRRALALPEEELPERIEMAPPEPAAQVVADILAALVRACADEAGVAAPYLTSPGELRAVVDACREGKGMPHMPLFESWRDTVAGRKVRGLLDGTLRVSLEAGRVQCIERSTP